MDKLKCPNCNKLIRLQIGVITEAVSYYHLHNQTIGPVWHGYGFYNFSVPVKLGSLRRKRKLFCVKNLGGFENYSYKFKFFCLNCHYRWSNKFMIKVQKYFRFKKFIKHFIK